jgi:RNA polymerase sigma-70 factor (ECF subfamily)
MIELALQALRSEWELADKQGEFQILCNFLPGGTGEMSYETAAAALSGSVAMVKSAVHRLRGDFRQSLRRVVAQTVSAPHEIDEELRYLRDILWQQS